MRLHLSILFSLLALVNFGQDKNLSSWVNPFIGTGGHGHTYPGVAMPFGMMQLSPDTRLDGWDGCGGYHYSDTVIYGFSHTHLSGTGVSDYGDLLIMPFTGVVNWENGAKNGTEGYGSTFSHSNEKAQAGLYEVLLDEDQIAVALTTTTRCGMHEYTYPKWDKKRIIIDLEHRDMVLDSDLIRLNDSTLIGKRISKAWATEQHFYFVVQFSEKIVTSEFRKNEEGKPSKMVIEFGHVNPKLTIKVGMSAVDIDGAKKNLKVEMPSWNFDMYKAQAIQKWNDELGKIDIQTSVPALKTTFYTALYHSFLNPNAFSDVDGRYRGMDNSIHQDKSRVQYTVFSLWDTFRASHPLFTLLQSERTTAFIQTFLAQYKEGGILPIWELAGNYTGCMIGYHSIPVIVDAYIKGYRDFDTELALKAMLYSAEQNHLGLEAYKRSGYISSEDESESVSKTLEYAYDDWCIAIFADSLGQDSIAEIYYQRAQFYKNLYNPASKFMQPRYNGGWRRGFKPEEVTFDYTEANSWQYSLFVPQDVDGLTTLLGGRDSLEAWLDRLFTVSSATSGREQADITGLIGQYAHGNEPSHHMAYLYNFTNAPWKTQKYVNQILQTLYSDKPDGLSGNEDCGQMSSWYVMSAMGFYSFAPGSDMYLTGTPLYDTTLIHFENGNELLIRRENFVLGNSYVSSIRLNGETLKRNFLYHHELISGGELVFVMDNKPSKVAREYPRSSIEKYPLLASPIIEDAYPAFDKKRKVALISNLDENTEVCYTLDGTEPTNKSKKYKKPIKIKKSTPLIAKAFRGELESYPVKGNFKKVNSDWKITLKSEYDNQYNAGGDGALIDQLTGSLDFRTGAWQGYYGKNIVAEIDFGTTLKINEIQMRFLQDIKSWIWMPKEVRFMISEDGEEWFTLHTAKNVTPLDLYGATVTNFGCVIFQSLFTRYLKIEAVNVGNCPNWHLGSGNPSWLFADEIIIR